MPNRDHLERVPQYLTPEEVAERLRLSRAAAYRLAKRLGSYPTARTLRVSEPVLLAYLDAKKAARR